MPVSTFAIKPQPDKVLGVYFSPAAKRFVVLHADAAPDAVEQRVKIDLHDDSGAYIKTFDLYQDLVIGTYDHLAGLSADGGKLLLRHTANRKSLEVWNLADGRKGNVWTWKSADDEEVISDLCVLDDERVLVNVSGRVILWNYAKNEEVYSLPRTTYSHTFQVSPGKKYFVVGDGDGLLMMQTADGQCRGRLAAPALGSLWKQHAAAFRRDGKVLAAVAKCAQGLRLVRWNLDSGQVIDDLPAFSDEGPLRWYGERFLIHDEPSLRRLYVIDARLPGTLTSFKINYGQALSDPPDDRYWYWCQSGDGPRVTARSVPPSEAGGLADLVDAGKLLPALPPGSTVQVEIDTNDETFRKQAAEAAEQALPARGYHVGPGGYRIKISAHSERTGKSLPVRLTRPDLGGLVTEISVQDYEVVIDCQLQDAQGVVLWQAGQGALGIPFQLTFTSDDYQRQVEEIVWANARTWARGLTPPSSLFRIDGRVERLPREEGDLPAEP